MRIRHLALSVSDAERSERFYMDNIGLEGTATTEAWGVRLRLDDGFMMALMQDDPVPSNFAGRVHFGCHLPDAGAVHRLRERLSDADVPEVEWAEEEGYASLKVRDPDGYIVELSWDVQ